MSERASHPNVARSHVRRRAAHRTARRTAHRAALRAAHVPARLAAAPVFALAAVLVVACLATSAALASATDADPRDSGVAGAPPVASSDPLDPSTFASELEAALDADSAWVRDPLRVALRFVDQPSTGATTVVRQDDEGGAATHVTLWLDGLRDDSLRAVWFEVRLERRTDGTWRVVSGRQAFWCARGDATEELVAGLCP